MPFITAIASHFHRAASGTRAGVVLQGGRSSMRPGLSAAWPHRDGSLRGARYPARELGKQGHEVRLESPQFVKPYIDGDPA
jgi:hypothetical protein